VFIRGKVLLFADPRSSALTRGRILIFFPISVISVNQWSDFFPAFLRVSVPPW
jgi:hypothetical protein